MKTFIRLTALGVGLGNGYLLLGRVPGGLVAYQALDVLRGIIIIAVIGLLTAEIVLKFGRAALEGAFWHRYTSLVSTMCLGGAFFGVTLALSGLLYDTSLGAFGLIGFSAVASLWGILWGSVLGLSEGLILGVPLTALLGAFGGRDR